MQFKSLKFTKIIGSKGVYDFAGGVYETDDEEEIKELSAILGKDGELKSGATNPKKANKK